METNMAATPHSFFLSLLVLALTVLDRSLLKSTEATIKVSLFVGVDYLVLYIMQN